MKTVEEDIESRTIEELSETGEQKQTSRTINYFEKFLPIWVVLCIIV